MYTYMARLSSKIRQPRATGSLRHILSRRCAELRQFLFKYVYVDLLQTIIFVSIKQRKHQQPHNKPLQGMAPGPDSY